MTPDGRSLHLSPNQLAAIRKETMVTSQVEFLLVSKSKIIKN
jgi:hypothetical protein